jgi:hypothetical protein
MAFTTQKMWQMQCSTILFKFIFLHYTCVFQPPITSQSTECQAADWKEHKTTCRPMPPEGTVEFNMSNAAMTFIYKNLWIVSDTAVKIM